MPGLYCTTHRFTNCCFCLSLKTGCKVIGALTAFICGLELVSACHKLIELLERERRCMEETDKWEEKEPKSFINICPHIKFVQFMLVIDFIKFVIGFNGSILLLYGIKTKQPKLFLAWLIFCGLVIFTNFFTILILRNLNVMNNLLIVLLLSYLFRVVRAYRLQLYEELNNGCPVVAVAFPQESGVHVFLPSQQPQTASDYIKDDPPPPYPGLPVVPSTLSLESQPPPYSVVNPTYEGPPIPQEPSSSTTFQLNTPEAEGISLQHPADGSLSVHSSSTSISIAEIDGSGSNIHAESLPSHSPTPSSTNNACSKEPLDQPSTHTPTAQSNNSSPAKEPNQTVSIRLVPEEQNEDVKNNSAHS